MNTRIISFHNGNIPQDVLQAQKKVFDKFELNLEQIETTLQHPDAIDHFLATEQWDVVAIFDVDSIPLIPGYVESEIEFVLHNKYLSGAVQHASHIPDSIDYVSPAFCVLSKEIFERLGKPSFAPTYRGDVGAELTYKAKENNVFTYMLPVTHVVKPMWPLVNGKMFGIGTTYGDVIYHAFESRMNTEARNLFIEKCDEVLRDK